MFTHTKSFIKGASKIKFGKLGMAGVTLFSGLGIATVVGNVPGVTPRAHALTGYTTISMKTISGYPWLNGWAYGCRTLRNSAFGQVADVDIYYTLSSAASPLAELRDIRPYSGQGGPITISYTGSSAWWNGTSLHLYTTASVAYNDYLQGNIGPTEMFHGLDPVSQLRACQ